MLASRITNNLLLAAAQFSDGPPAHTHGANFLCATTDVTFDQLSCCVGPVMAVLVGNRNCGYTTSGSEHIEPTCTNRESTRLAS